MKSKIFEKPPNPKSESSSGTVSINVEEVSNINANKAKNIPTGKESEIVEPNKNQE